jgi:6-phosphogluconate dehydrogenase
MEIAIIGTGRMGRGIALRLLEKKHKVVACNRHPEPLDELKAKGARVTTDPIEAVRMLAPPRIIWSMLPAGDVTEQTFTAVLGELAPGDIIIEGGNSHYKDSLRRAQIARIKGVNFLDAGVSGGLAGATQGYCIMAGGDKEIFAHCEPIFRDIAMADGYSYVGPSGAGHYVKMVHNAIEYAQMQAIGEGFEVLKDGHYKADNLDLHAIARLWNHGSIVRGYLMECTESALAKDARLEKIADYIEDNGEGRWTILEALEHGIPFLSGTHALYSRYLSRQPESFAFKIVAAQRGEFGGHKVKEK